MTVVISDEAEADLSQICRWYEKQQVSLSDYFIRQFESSLQHIITHPEVYRFVFTGKQARCYTVLRFPYKIFYVAEMQTNTIKVLAVIHKKRSDRYGRKRLR